jgi:hypothetical protein
MRGSYCSSGRQDSNLGPPGPKPGTLPDCATPRTISLTERESEEKILINKIYDHAFRNFCDPPGTRTRNLLLRRQLLYPIELADQHIFIWPPANFGAERGGFEPPVPIAQYRSLANCWFKPLTHLSNILFFFYS